MNIQEIFEKLKAGKIKVNGCKHNAYHDLAEHVERQLHWYLKHQSECAKAVETNDTSRDLKSDARMVAYYDRKLTMEYEVGEYLLDGSIDMICQYCDANLYAVLTEQDTLSLIGSTKYWKLASEFGIKHEFKLKTEEAPICESAILVEAKMLTADIEVPSGELIFVNFFHKDELYEDPVNYRKPSICSLLGRDTLMQYLAGKNVGYGQMSNMSVNIYSNENDEIVVASSNMGEDWDDEDQEDPKVIPGDDYYTQDRADYIVNENIERKKFKDEIEAKGFKNLGNISCEVWRWMCADKQVLVESGEDLEKKHESLVTCNVTPGTWHIEHYFDSPDCPDVVYSRLKLIK